MKKEQNPHKTPLQWYGGFLTESAKHKRGVKRMKSLCRKGRFTRTAKSNMVCGEGLQVGAGSETPARKAEFTSAAKLRKETN